MNRDDEFSKIDAELIELQRSLELRKLEEKVSKMKDFDPVARLKEMNQTLQNLISIIKEKMEGNELR